MFSEKNKISHLTLQQIKKIFTSEVFETHSDFRFIGNHGDPIFHPQLQEVLAYFRKNKAKKLLINTNGSGRNEAWWEEVSSVLTVDDVVLFSIDGLESTNGIYRINSRWNEIIGAIKVLRGRVKLGWKFIVFSHNQHQLKEAIEMAESLGFNWISFDYSNRWGAQELSENFEVMKAAQELMPAQDFITLSEVEIPHRWPGNYQLMRREVFALPRKTSNG